MSLVSLWVCWFAKRWFERIKTGIGGRLVGLFVFCFSGLIIWWFILQLVHVAALALAFI